MHKLQVGEHYTVQGFALNNAFTPLETNFQEIWKSVRMLTTSQGALTYLFLSQRQKTENSSRFLKHTIIHSKNRM